MNKVPCGGFELDESLALNNGKLGLAPGAGSGGAFVVNIVKDSDGAYTLNKTYEEIENAIESGVFVLGCVIEVYPNGMQALNYVQLSQYVQGVGVAFVLTQVIKPTNTVMFSTFSIAPSGEVISASISVSGAT